MVETELEVDKTEAEAATGVAEVEDADETEE